MKNIARICVLFVLMASCQAKDQASEVDEELERLQREFDEETKAAMEDLNNLKLSSDSAVKDASEKMQYMIDSSKQVLQDEVRK